MTRAKVAGLRRNIAVAIGNSGDAEAIDALDEVSANRPSLDDVMVKEHIEWARAQTLKPKA
jgi:epoxyqueuosine reductase QueG